MLDLLRKLFQGTRKTDNAEAAPYKVETPQTTVGTVPMTTQYAEPAQAKKKPAAKKPTGEKKPAVKAKTARTKKKAS